MSEDIIDDGSEYIVKREPVKTKIIGLGKAGCNMANYAIALGYPEDDVCAIDTGSKIEETSKASTIIPIETDPEDYEADSEKYIGEILEEYRDDIYEFLEDANIVFVTAGLGGKFGTYSISKILSLLKEKGVYSIAMTTMPYVFEGTKRINIAASGAKKVFQLATLSIEKDYERIRQKSGEKLDFKYAYAKIPKIIAKELYAFDNAFKNNLLVGKAKLLQIMDEYSKNRGLGFILGASQTDDVQKALNEINSKIAKYVRNKSFKYGTGILVYEYALTEDVMVIDDFIKKMKDSGFNRIELLQVENDELENNVKVQFLVKTNENIRLLSDSEKSVASKQDTDSKPQNKALDDIMGDLSSFLKK